MVTSFVLNTRAEFLKSKRTAAFWLTVVGAAFIPVINFISLVAQPDHFLRVFKGNPWLHIINNNWEVATIFLLPMYVILVTSLVVQIEYRNNTWKQVYTLPRTLADIFFSRFIVIHALILFCFILFSASIILASYAANLVQKQYTFFDHPVPWERMFLLIVKTYFSVLAMAAIQYWLSLRFRNFILSVGIGLGLLVTGLIIHSWEHLYYYPYMYPAISFMRNFEKIPSFVAKAQLFNVIWFVLVLLIGFFDFVKRKEKG
ncbi:MAG TPA: ABC transporter permease [Niastella sp.]